MMKEREMAMAKEIEKSILYVVHNMHFTANQLAIIHILYNSDNSGMTVPEIGSRMPSDKQGKTISGILSQLARAIDRLENPEEKFGFTGYLLFFERFEGDLHNIRPEFRHVIDQHGVLRNVSKIHLKQIFSDYPTGLDLQ